MERGYARLFDWRGVPVLVHWSIVLGLLVVGGGFRYNPGAWLGFALIIVVHEMGHAWLAMRYRRPVLRIEMHAMGGLCVHERGTARQRAVIAWGGVMGQLVLFAVAEIGLKLGLWPATPFFATLADTLLGYNLFIAGFNLLPFRPLDGAQAWKVFRRSKADRSRDSRLRRRGFRIRPGPRHDVKVIDRAAIDDLVDQALEDARTRPKSGD